MSRTNQNVTMWQGEAKTLVSPIVNAAGTAVSLTGAAISWRLYDVTTGVVLLTKTTAAGSVALSTTTATNDTVTVTLDPADTVSLEGAYYHEAAITGSQAAVLYTGVLTINVSAVL